MTIQQLPGSEHGTGLALCKELPTTCPFKLHRGPGYFRHLHSEMAVLRHCQRGTDPRSHTAKRLRAKVNSGCVSLCSVLLRLPALYCLMESKPCPSTSVKTQTPLFYQHVILPRGWKNTPGLSFCHPFQPGSKPLPHSALCGGPRPFTRMLGCAAQRGTLRVKSD